jgi:hypothetical protein
MSARVGLEFPEIKRRVLRPHDKRQSIANQSRLAAGHFDFSHFFGLTVGFNVL